jgi:SAM-dependent methyltransferase
VSVEERPDWLLDEFSYAGRENLDPDHVGRYDSKMDASAVQELEVSRAFELGASSTLVEFGAGTGQLTIEAARVCGRVVAVDVSRPMLASLEAKVASAGLVNIDAVNAGFLAYRCDAGSVDFVYSRLALHHLPDFWKVHALQRISDMLKVGGVCRIWDASTRGPPPIGWRPGALQAKGFLRSPLWRTDGAGGKSPSTSAMSTRPTRGCSRRCSIGRVSLSSNASSRTTPRRSTSSARADGRRSRRRSVVARPAWFQTRR